MDPYSHSYNPVLFSGILCSCTWLPMHLFSIGFLSILFRLFASDAVGWCCSFIILVAHTCTVWLGSSTQKQHEWLKNLEQMPKSVCYILLLQQQTELAVCGPGICVRESENVYLLSADPCSLFSIICSPFLLLVSRTFPAAPFFFVLSCNMNVVWVFLGTPRHCRITDREISRKAQ